MFEGYYKKSRSERLQILRDYADLTDAELAILDDEGALPFETANHMVENMISTFQVPLGLGLNMVVNGKKYAVPMATEEPSVIAAMSSASKLIAQSGGLKATSSGRLMVGQLAVYGVLNFETAKQTITEHQTFLLDVANAAYPSLLKRGGGARELIVREVETTEETIFVVHLHVETLEAMGANMINTMVEALCPDIEQLTGGTAEMKILSNLTDQATATATCTIPVNLLFTNNRSGEEVRDRIVRAFAFSDADIYRAATHNKGIMNGIDAVLLAFGNDVRSIEASAHAYTAKDGRYRPMSRWSVNARGDLVGELTLPMPVATVGGSIAISPLATLAKKIAKIENAEELAMLAVSVGLAQNLAALKALVTEGIQRGHMALQAKSTAISAGATGEEIERVAERMLETGQINLSEAKKIMKEER
ncbi:hydroxymethylglutaryl-CoA reductase, degradative [Listeria fleischmannii]|uniref:3-hydroxy-3-methylglutaryl coenzyme A reductase n=1 Tax=Listeria fleischmannii TaxID=1069827 RepID=A0A841YGG9_9LIST|nr:hydroxymethylglutaryl-CoA reductase, degradative [Listeria fleischmannii]MBC1399320.1 hydroxymethylglutaryl-CoA reductase, degradative [Listeria fleischmannii]MBC1427746.1 hydroxymethylglutaryl-CoA reductase, degradative [Listeria fleischmannii]STY35768.1 3-hydroxy-3-methylglutaryl-coenzyme A reductase [Listeria fleischmannii subsp. coloradonensis]